MTNASNDEQPTGIAHNDSAAGMSDDERTIAAEHQSEAPTTIVPDVGPTRGAQLAWSSEGETQEIADRSGPWRGRLLWVPLVALLCASVAVVVWFSLTVVPAAPAAGHRFTYAAAYSSTASYSNTAGGHVTASGAATDSADQRAADNHTRARTGKRPEDRRTMSRLVKDRTRSQHRPDHHL